ncbi:MAG: HD domain-containing phosphohydrolase [Lachnospiraceae bacterium]
MTYVNEAAQVFDIGKIKIGEIINKQSRQLTERERKRIRKHCEDGYEITRKGKLLRKYGDVVLGHHKSYDGKWDIRQILTTPPRLIVFYRAHPHRGQHGCGH